MIHIAFDTEDDSCGNPCIINFFDGRDHVTFRGKPEMIRRKAWDHLLTFRGSKERVILWACNLEYDLINLFGDFLGSMTTLQYVRAGLLRASFKDAPITFFDTLRHWAISVKEMGKIIGLQKLETESFENIEYCQRDTEIVWRFVASMLARYESFDLKLKATLPSMSLQLFNKFYEIPKNCFDDETLRFFRRGYYGGRVEVLRFGKIEGHINHYDFNSLFPSVMAENVYPDIRYDKGHAVRALDLTKEGMAELKIWQKACFLSPVPYRSHELFFPTGYIRGVWTYPEIRCFLENGARIEKVYGGIEFREQCSRPFASYIDWCYSERLKSRNKCDNLFYKLMANSLYGKFAQNSGIEIIYNDKDMKQSGKVGHVNVIWSAYVTAYARIKLFNSLKSCSESYYCDTDSIFTPDDLSVSNDLGKLKKEGVYKEVEFIGNKIYYLDADYKAKGVPRKNAEEFIKTGKSVYRKPLRFRAARSRALKANVWMEFEKEKKFVYSKRQVLPNGNTWAWDLKEYVDRFN